MTGRHPSRTAQGVAFLRAVHQVLDAQPSILNDPVVLSLIGPSGVQQIKDEPERFQTIGARALRAHVVLRSRFAEDRLAAAVGRGVTQYIILGAGFDTFALRQPMWALALRVIEVDQLATQALKRAQLAAAHVEVPENVTFASIDFERESLRDGLRRHRVSFEEPTFFSWLGVTMYLTEDAIDAVFRTVAMFPAGSEIVFTFAQPREPKVGSASPTLAELAASVGEPWLTYFEPDALERKLRGMGFTAIKFLTPPAAGALYFSDRSDELPIPVRTTIASAM